MRKQKGITLIALVVTIVVLLILAGVSINLVLGNNGIISKAKEARVETRGARVEEEKNLWKSDLDIHKYTGQGESKALGELLNELLSNELITEEEKQEILDKGVVKIGSRTIEFITDDEKPTIVNIKKGTALPAGTEENPYQIFSIEDLVQLSINVNSGDSYEGKYMKMMRTLDFNDDNSYLDAHSKEFGNLNGNDNDGNELKTEMTTGTGFTPLAQEKDMYFSGKFEGNNNKIKNIYINTTGYGSFITKVKNAEISNLEITGNIESEWPAGLIGNAEANSSLKIKNCINGAKLNTKANFVGAIVFSVGSNAEVQISDCINNTDLSGNLVGGIVGQSSSGIEISNCINNGNITSNLHLPVGGIIAFCSSSDAVTIKNCKNKGGITVTQLGDLGGILGQGNKVNINGCENNGPITSTASYDPASSDKCVGGIIGRSLNGGNITKCLNREPISAKAYNIGGIAGKIQGTGNITNCGNFAELNTQAPYVGGICGYSEVNVASCANEAKIHNSGDLGNVNPNPGPSVGGCVGFAIPLTAVENCYNTSEIYTQYGEYIGGVVGFGVEAVSNCYNLGNISGDSNQIITHGAGIVGYSQNSPSESTTNCCNYADINVVGANVGGITNWGNGNVENCYNSGNVTACKKLIDKKYTQRFIGGIVGGARNNAQTFKNCYNTGNITNEFDYNYASLAEERIGGICAARSGGTMENCYNSGAINPAKPKTSYLYEIADTEHGDFVDCAYLTRTNNVEAGNAVGKTEAEMRQIMDIGNFTTKLNSAVNEHNKGNPEFMWSFWTVKNGKAVFDINWQ